MEGLPLPHTSKCNLYLFRFPVLTPPTLPRSRLLLGNLTSLLHRCCAVLLLPCHDLLLCSWLGKSHTHLCFPQSASRDTASSAVLGRRWESSEEDENVGDILCCLKQGELSSSWCLLCIYSDQKGIGSQLFNSFIYSILREPLTSWAGNREQNLAQDQG